MEVGRTMVTTLPLCLEALKICFGTLLLSDLAGGVGDRSLQLLGERWLYHPVTGSTESTVLSVLTVNKVWGFCGEVSCEVSCVAVLLGCC